MLGNTLSNSEGLSGRSMSSDATDMQGYDEAYETVQENDLDLNRYESSSDEDDGNERDAPPKAWNRGRLYTSLAQLPSSTSDGIVFTKPRTHLLWPSNVTFDSPRLRMSWKKPPPSPEPSFEENRERLEEWNTEEIVRMSRSLRLRTKQTKRLIMKMFRKRQMERETLAAFKRRLRRM